MGKPITTNKLVTLS